MKKYLIIASLLAIVTLTSNAQTDVINSDIINTLSDNEVARWPMDSWSGNDVARWPIESWPGNEVTRWPMESWPEA